MQAIRTRYIGPTNVRGSRVKADCEAGSITLDWDDAMNSEANHIAARDALLAKLGWNVPPYAAMIMGSHGNAEYHVFMPRSKRS